MRKTTKKGCAPRRVRDEGLKIKGWLRMRRHDARSIARSARIKEKCIKKRRRLLERGREEENVKRKWALWMRAACEPRP
jgi:hypothetical protein